MELNKELWVDKDYALFINFLISQKDQNYLDFHKKLVETKDTIIGVRTPILKKMAKEISRGNYLDFIYLNKGNFYEMTLIEGLILGNIGYQKESLNLLYNFISKIDNWATCDLVISNLKWVKKEKELIFSFIQENLSSQNPWMRRFCFVLLLDYYIEEEYLDFIFEVCERYNMEHYYVKMAISWLISMCFVKYKDKTLNYLNHSLLDTWTYNKALQKIRESTRVTKEEKEMVQRMKK